MKLTPARMVKLYLVYVLCMASDVFIRIFSGVGTPSAGGKSTFLHSENSNPILLAFTALLVGWTLLLAVPIHRTVVRSLLSAPWVTALYLEASLSILWSVEPAATFRYSIYLWIYMLAGVLCSLYLESAETIDLLGNTLSGIALLSIFAQFHYPQANAAPGWTGVYGEKNHLGIGMTIGIIALLLPRARWTLFRAAKLALCGTLLLLSQSGTAVVCTVVITLMMLCLRAPRRVRRPLVACLLGTATLGFLLVPNLLDRLLAAGGKDATLTGRDVIWRFSVQQWQRKPLLGWGYSSFWNSQDALIQQHLGWNPSYSHNGFLEIGLSLGILGDVILVGLLVGALALAIRVRRRSHELAGLWLLLSLAIVFLHDLTEVDFLIPAPLWVVFGIAYFSAVAARKRALVPAPALSPMPISFFQLPAQQEQP